MEIRGNKGFFAYFRKFKSIIIDENSGIIKIVINIHKRSMQRICLPLTLSLCTFQNNHCIDLVGHTGLEKNKKKYNGQILFSKSYNLDQNTDSRLHTMSNKQNICKHKNKK